MALFRDDSGKTEKPTPTRLEELRKKGDTNMSRELNTAGLMMISAILLWLLGNWIGSSLQQALVHGLNVDLRDHPIEDGTVHGAVREILGCLGLVAAPLLLLMSILAATAAVLCMAQVGLKLSSEAVRIRLDKLNPASNIQKVFNMQAVMRAAFAIVKLAALALVLWLALRDKVGQLAVLTDQDVADSIGAVSDIAFTILIWVSTIVLVLAIADVFYQRFDFTQRNMMTKQEVDDERKRSEGDPMVRSRLRQARAELMRHRMMEAVPKADVIITNPTHYSIALRYQRGKNTAPEVVAKGVDELAMRIRELAKEHDVPLLEDPPLARALYRAVKVGQEVPARFYEAVATVLSHVYRLKNRVA